MELLKLGRERYFKVHCPWQLTSHITKTVDGAPQVLGWVAEGNLEEVVQGKKED